jgi:DNA-binding NarL/FixJ family response regulator
MKEIGLIEDESILRNAYFKYFNSTKLFKVVFAVSDIDDAIALNTVHPSIILLDVHLPSGSGIDGIKTLLSHFPNSKIVILSGTEEESLTKLALKNGATGFLLKSSSLAYISESLLKIDEGGIPFSPGTITHIIQSDIIEATTGTISFTKRELELIKLISQGMANKIAADKLQVTYFTVNQHLKNIYKKLGINSKGELISWFLNRKG